MSAVLIVLRIKCSCHYAKFKAHLPQSETRSVRAYFKRFERVYGSFVPTLRKASYTLNLSPKEGEGL